MQEETDPIPTEQRSSVFVSLETRPLITKLVCEDTCLEGQSRNGKNAELPFLRFSHSFGNQCSKNIL